MNFEILKEKMNALNCESKAELKEFEKNLNIITQDDFNNLVNNIFSDKVKELDVNKLPYVIDELYQSNDKFTFMLCCVLLEATCFDLPFLTCLENYPLSKEKYDILKNTLITVYDTVDSGIADCMALIILNNDPSLNMLDDEEKYILINAAKRKLNGIIDYIKNVHDIEQGVYNELAPIINLACYMDDNEIDKEIKNLDSLPLDFSCRLFLAKYKLINNITIGQSEIEKLLTDKKNIHRVVDIFEMNGGISLLVDAQIKQEELALSCMVEWLKYPSELGKEPDEIQCVATFDFNNNIVYVYEFKSDVFKDREYMIGVSGGFPKDMITCTTVGWTFSKFEPARSDVVEQGKELVEFVIDYWKNKATNY